ncbi:ornithine carbamoyltransferase [Candidatus Woesearchaeota archaeon]|nr:ornithine carbamoyltransferase [Candidatus Woesearchaeota archaeon]
MKHLLSLKDYSKEEILDFISLAEKVKKKPRRYSKKLKGKTLLMLFAKPSLRTHLSFDIAMYQLGGHAIFYDLSHSVLGEKESIKDFSKVTSRYVNVIMARLYGHEQIEELAKYSSVPIINGLTNFEHPAQVLGDLLTIKEIFGKLEGIKLTYMGDADNNVTNSLIYACPKVGIKLNIICPRQLKPKIPGKYSLSFNPKDAKGQIIYTDTWYSYHVEKSQYAKRKKLLRKFQVNKKLLGNAKFMHCLPATRGDEVTDEVMDSKQSLVYDQAYNRLPIQQAILLKLLKY